MKHDVSILENRAGCSCRRWQGAYRMNGETQGNFTSRAYELHAQHLADVRDRATIQPSLFDRQTSLFDAVNA